MSSERYLSVMVEWDGHSAALREILMPIVEDLQTQLDDGRAGYFVRKGLPKIKAAFCRPADLFWTPGITLDEARWVCRDKKPVRSYLEMETHMMRYFSQSMDIVDEDEFLIGNWFDSSIYYVSKSHNGAWRIPTTKGVGPFSSNVF
jgi:hypothetical protein